MISGFCIIVFVRIEYRGDTKMFSPILELNNFSVCTVRSVFFFVFCFSHLSQINMIWDLVYSCGVFLLYESHCIWLDRLLHYLFGFLKLIGFKATEIISTEKKCFHKWFRNWSTQVIQKVGTSLRLRSGFGKFTAVMFGKLGRSTLTLPEMVIFTLPL